MTSLPSTVSRWVPSQETKCIPESEYVELAEIDISNLISDPAATSTAARTAIDRAFQGFQETGFIVITGHGLSPEVIARQFDLGNMYLSVNEEVKHQFHANISEGSWAGYKPQGYFKRINGAHDSTEFHDFYPETITKEHQPPVSWPYLDEIQSFYELNHFVILRTVLSILSQGLGLHPDSFWELHHRRDGCPNTIHTKDMFRAAMYYPPSEEDRDKAEKLWLPVHTDRGSLTFLYSQPTAGLQIFLNGGWKYVRHYPNGILVNLGDAMEFTTGGLLKAAVHRVHEPPSDQRNVPRLGLFYFATMLPEVILRPLDSLTSRAQPLAAGIFDEFGGKTPTAGDWQISRAKVTGKPADQELVKKRFPVQFKAKI